MAKKSKNTAKAATTTSAPIIIKLPLTSYHTSTQAAAMKARGLTPGVDPIPDDLLLDVQREK